MNGPRYHAPTTLMHAMKDAGGFRLIDRDECKRRHVSPALVWAVLEDLTENVDRRTNVTHRSHMGIAETLGIATREQVSKCVAVAIASHIVEYVGAPVRGRVNPVRWCVENLAPLRPVPVDNEPEPVSQPVSQPVSLPVSLPVSIGTQDPDPDPENNHHHAPPEPDPMPGLLVGVGGGGVLASKGDTAAAVRSMTALGMRANGVHRKALGPVLAAGLTPADVDRYLSGRIPTPTANLGGLVVAVLRELAEDPNIARTGTPAPSGPSRPIGCADCDHGWVVNDSGVPIRQHECHPAMASRRVHG